jgi:hypothetical protein
MQIYIIGPAGGPYKVGIATKVEKRLSELQIATYQRLVIHAVADVESRDEARRLEAEIHARLSQFELSGEWFGCSLEQAAAAFTVPVQVVEDIEQIRSDAYRVLFALASEVPAELRRALADHVGAELDTPEAIAQARVDAILPRR